MKKVVVAFMFFLASKSFGQDPIFTQFYNVPETLNPSFTAVNGNTKVSVAHRTQWPGLSYKLNSQFANFSAYADNINSGFGLSLLNLLESHTRYRFSQATLNYAYRVKLTNSWVFIPSLSVGYGNKDFNFDSLVLEDQIDIVNGSIRPTSIDPIILNTTTNFFDFSVGGLFMNEAFWFGLGVRHLNSPNIAFESNKNKPLDIFLSAHAGLAYDLDNIFYYWDDSKLRLLLNFMSQGVYKRFDVGTEVEMRNGFTLGAILATSPIKYNELSYTLNSLNLTTGVVWDNFRVGYSYDVNLSGLKGAQGVHEITLTYTFRSIFNSSFRRCRCQY